MIVKNALNCENTEERPAESPLNIAKLTTQHGQTPKKIPYPYIAKLMKDTLDGFFINNTSGKAQSVNLKNVKYKGI